MGKVERALLDILKECGGEVYQSELVKISGFSRSRVSEVLSEMTGSGLVSKYPIGIGKNVNVVLKAGFKRRKKNGSTRTRKLKRILRLGFTRAAEYPFVIPFRRLVKNKLDLDLEFRIYNNGIDVTRDLSLLRLDLGISPILTQFMFHSLGSPLMILAPAGSGGSSLLLSSKKGLRARYSDRKTEFRIASSKLSTMELLMRSSVKEDLIPKSSAIVYTSSPDEIMEDMLSGSVNAACLWEPYATVLLEKKKTEFSRLMRYSDMGEHLCCTLAAGKHLGGPLLDKVRRIFLESIGQYVRGRNTFTAPYARLTGFDQKVLGQVSG